MQREFFVDDPAGISVLDDRAYTDDMSMLLLLKVLRNSVTKGKELK